MVLGQFRSSPELCAENTTPNDCKHSRYVCAWCYPRFYSPANNTDNLEGNCVNIVCDSWTNEYVDHPKQCDTKLDYEGYPTCIVSKTALVAFGMWLFVFIVFALIVVYCVRKKKPNPVLLISWWKHIFTFFFIVIVITVASDFISTVENPNVDSLGKLLIFLTIYDINHFINLVPDMIGSEIDFTTATMEPSYSFICYCCSDISTRKKLFKAWICLTLVILCVFFGVVFAAIYTRDEHKETLNLSVAAFIGESLHVLYFHTNDIHKHQESVNQDDVEQKSIDDIPKCLCLVKKATRKRIRFFIIFVYWILSLVWVVKSGDREVALQNHAVLIVYYKGLQLLPQLLDNVELCCEVNHCECCCEQNDEQMSNQNHNTTIQ
eukprot:394677_1